MFYTTVANASQKRTIRPVYAHHQATPQAMTLYSGWSTATADIYPGMVAQKVTGEVVTLSDGGDNATSGASPSYGLFAHFIAPVLGIDEVTDSGLNLVGVWVGGPDSQFEILAPAWDSELPTDFWSESSPNAALVADSGDEILLVPGSGTANRGRLCPQTTADYTGAGDYAGHDIDKDADPVAKLISKIDDTTILVSLIHTSS
jgi:hypothetical protein